GFDQLDPAQRRRPQVKGIEADVEPRCDDAAQVLTLFRDGVEGRGGAEVDDHAGPTVEVEGTDGVGYAVRADFPRILGEDRHTGSDTGFDHDRFESEVAVDHLPERRGYSGHDRGDGNASDVL